MTAKTTRIPIRGKNCCVWGMPKARPRIHSLNSNQIPFWAWTRVQKESNLKTHKPVLWNIPAVSLDHLSQPCSLPISFVNLTEQETRRKKKSFDLEQTLLSKNPTCQCVISTIPILNPNHSTGTAADKKLPPLELKTEMLKGLLRPKLFYDFSYGWGRLKLLLKAVEQQSQVWVRAAPAAPPASGRCFLKQISFAVVTLWAGQKLCSWFGASTACHLLSPLSGGAVQGWNDPTCRGGHVLWPYSIAEVPPVTLCMCVNSKKHPGWGREMLWVLLDHSDPLWVPFTWPQVTPPSKLMLLELPARGYQLQGATFRWVYMKKSLTPPVYNGRGLPYPWEFKKKLWHFKEEKLICTCTQFSSTKPWLFCAC